MTSVIKMWYTNATVYRSGKFTENVSFLVEDGKFKSLSVNNDAVLPEAHSLEGLIVVPGFIDQHIHGSVGCDFMDGKVEGNKKIAKYLPSIGVTSFLATTLTEDPQVIKKALTALEEAFSDADYEGAQCLGVHLEGPFISPMKKGAHVQKWIATPSVEAYKALVGTCKVPVKVVTIAPECDEKHDLIKYLSSKGIVPSAGHSLARYDQMHDAVQNGVKCVTHCYNAMSSITARDGGVLGAALSMDGLCAELIADGVHVSPENIKMFHKMKPENDKILISDAMRARGSEVGIVGLGGLEAIYDGKKVVLADGTLAGSALKQLDAMRHYASVVSAAVEAVLPMLTENPARLLQIERQKGMIEVGYDADFLVLDAAYQLMMTVCRGKVSYRRDEK